jgi:hypothetical protein
MLMATIVEIAVQSEDDIQDTGSNIDPDTDYLD